MKSRRLKKIVFIGVIFLWIGAASCTDPLHDEPRYKVKNNTTFSMVQNIFNNGNHVGEIEANASEIAYKDGGGQLTADSIMFVRGANIENGQLKNPIDSVFYINPRHLTDQAYELVKGRSFFNIENWISEGKDFVYSVYDSDFE